MTPINDMAAGHRKCSSGRRARNIDEPSEGVEAGAHLQAAFEGIGSNLGGALIEAKGWLPATTRAARIGLRKRGYSFLLERQDGKSSIYRVARSHDHGFCKWMPTTMRGDRGVKGVAHPPGSIVRPASQFSLVYVRYGAWNGGSPHPLHRGQAGLRAVKIPRAGRWRAKGTR